MTTGFFFCTYFVDWSPWTLPLNSSANWALFPVSLSVIHKPAERGKTGRRRPGDEKQGGKWEAIKRSERIREVQGQRWTPLTLRRVCLISISVVTVSSWKLMHVHLDFQLPTIPCDPTSSVGRMMLFPDLTNTKHTRCRQACALTTFICINTSKKYTKTHIAKAVVITHWYSPLSLSPILLSHNICITFNQTWAISWRGHHFSKWVITQCGKLSFSFQTLFPLTSETLPGGKFNPFQMFFRFKAHHVIFNVISERNKILHRNTTWNPTQSLSKRFLKATWNVNSWYNSSKIMILFLLFFEKLWQNNKS